MELPDLATYLREFSKELGDRILSQYPPLYDPAEPVSPVLATLRRKAYPAQEVAIMSVLRRLEAARSAAIIGEMGTGKTFMAMAAVHAHAKGSPYTCLVGVPGQLILKWARELLHTIPGARVFVIDSLRSERPGMTGPQAVNEVRLVKGRVIRDGVRTSLTDIRLSKGFSSARRRWFHDHGPEPHFFLCGRDRLKLGYFWRHSYAVPRSGPYNGIVVNPDSGCPVLAGEEERRLLRSDFEKKRFDEVLDRHTEDGRPRRALYSPLWQADNERIRRFAPIEFIGRYMPEFFRYGIADEVHEAKAINTAQGNALGRLAAAVDKLIVLTGTLTGGMATDVFSILYRIEPRRLINCGYEYGPSGMRSFAETYGVLETITTIKPEDNACSKASVSKQVKQRPGASPLVFAKFLMDIAAFISLEDISADLPPYREDIITVAMDEPLAKAYSALEDEIKDALREHRGNPTVISTALNALLLYPDRPFDLGPLYGSEYNPQTGRREPFLIADPADLDSAVLYAKERKLIEIVREALSHSRKVQVFATYTQKRDVLRRLESILTQAGFHVAVMTVQVPPEQREAWYERQLAAGAQVFLCHPRLVQTGLDILACPEIVWYQTGYSTFTLRQASRRSWRIGQKKPVAVRFLCYDRTAQSGCLRLMGKKLLVSLALEGKFSDHGLQAMDDGDDVLTALAKELVMEKGVGESAADVWRQLRTEPAIPPAQDTGDETPLANPMPLVASQSVADPVQLSLF